MDWIHPFIYGAFGVLLTTKTSLFAGVRTRAYRMALLSLPAAGVFDLLENAGRLYLLSHGRGERGLSVVNVPDRPDIHVGFCALKLRF